MLGVFSGLTGLMIGLFLGKWFRRSRSLLGGPNAEYCLRLWTNRWKSAGIFLVAFNIVGCQNLPNDSAILFSMNLVTVSLSSSEIY